VVASFPPARAVIFDMDGLLIDSEPFWRAVEIAVFAGHGVDIAPLLGRGLTMGMRVDEVVRFFRSRLGFTVPSDDALVAEIVAGIVERVRTEGQLMPGALEAVALCEISGVSIALASGSTWPVIDAVLETTGLVGRFAVVSSAEDDVLGKPHPGILLRTAAALGVEPIECVVLEDSLNGCIAAKSARMRVIAVPDATARDDPRFSISDLVLASLTDLEASLGSMLGRLTPAEHWGR
jgi:mannitol-1-/sugar-/sorbitol-6-/2-deoxyglucose-6-phosphatase